MARNTAHGAKVPFYKTWWFWVIIILFIYGFVSGINSDDEEGSEEATETEELSKAFWTADEDPFAEDVIKACGQLL